MNIVDKKTPTEKYGLYSRYDNGDKTMTIYRDGEFIAAIENDSASCRLFYVMANELTRLNSALQVAKDALKYYKETRSEIELKSFALSSNFKGADCATRALTEIESIEDKK